MGKISRQRYLFTEAGTYYIDLWRSTSMQERKLHRQFQVCHVRGGLIKDSNNDSVVRINVAPDIWPIRSALKRGKRMWDKHIRQGTEGLPLSALKPKYFDYKVFLNPAMTSSTQYPVDAAGNNLPHGEWTYSRYNSEDVDWSSISGSGPDRDADTFVACIVGDQHYADSTNANYWSRISLIKSWFDSRPSPNPDGEPYGFSSDAVSEDPLVNLFDEADASDEVVEMLQDHNDRPPYAEQTHWGMIAPNPQEIGDNLQRVAMAATQDGAGQIASLNGFSAICGLLQVHITQTGSGQVEMILDVDTKGAKI